MDEDDHKAVRWILDENSKLQLSIDVLSTKITALDNDINIIKKRLTKVK